MQIYTSLGNKWESDSVKPFLKLFIRRFPVELISLFSFIIVVQQFIVENSYSKLIYLSWTILIYLMYKLRSHCNSEYFNRDLNLNIDELIDLFHQLPNCNLFKDVLFSDDDASSIDWINYLILKLWPKLINYFDKKLKKINLNLFNFFSLENFTVGLNPPIIESLNSSIISHDREERLRLKFNLYWFANDNSKRLVCLKFLNHTVGSLVSFCFKCSCQIEFKFIHWQINEDLQLNNIKFSLLNLPSLNYINSTGLISLLHNLQLIRPIILVYLKEKFLYPKCILFKFNLSSLIKKELRRPRIGLPVGLFCIDIIQAENIPSQKYKKSELDKQSNLIKTNITKLKSKKHIKKRKKYTINKQSNQLDNTINELKKLEPKPTKICLLNCLNYYTANVYCKVKIFNHQFTSNSIINKNPFWNFRSLIPIFSHNQHTIEQLNKYHSLFNKDNEIKNPIDLNSSFYQDKKFDSNLIYVKKFISYDLLENLSINIQIIDKNNQKLIADFSLNDPSHYFLDNEFNGQSIWINSITPNVITNNLDPSIKLNVRFTFITLNQTLNPIILSNAYLGNRLAFPIGALLIFVDSLIGLNEGYINSLRLNLNSEFGFQFIFQLGNQILHTSISTDLSFIWENELLFCVYSLDLEKINIKLVARNLNTNESNSITLASSKLDLSNLIYQPEFKQLIYCPFVLKFDKIIQLKLLLSFRITYFTTKLTVNCLRNAKVAEEDILIKGKQILVDDKFKPNLKAKSYDEEILEKKLSSEKLKIQDNNEHQDSNDDIHSVDLNDETTLKQPNKNINSSIDVLVKMKWPSHNKFVIEIVSLDCSQFLALFQIYSIDVYLNCALREKEKILQSKRTKNFQLKSQTVILNQELQFNCISKPLNAYHLNLSINEKRTEEYNKIAELYTPLPSLILASGQIDKKLVLNLTPMYLNFLVC